MSKLTRNKNQRGFTLVEVIVVAIIVAALAAVAIPLYNSYVTSSKNNAAANASGSVASFMGSCINQSGTASSSGGEAAGAAIVGPKTLSCAIAGIANAPTIQIPTGVTITISSYTASGTVTGSGGSGAGFVDQVYHY